MAKKIKPPSDSVGAQQYQYIDLPSSMEDCYYDLELVEFKLSDDESKYFAEFKVLDTDTKVRKGSSVSHSMDPYQKWAETYFWRDVFTIYLVTKGKEASKELIDALKPKHQKILDKMVNGQGVGGCCTARLKAYEKDGERKYSRSWEPLSAEE
jgi:hypothetical protein